MCRFIYFLRVFIIDWLPRLASNVLNQTQVGAHFTVPGLYCRERINMIIKSLFFCNLWRCRIKSNKIIPRTCKKQFCFESSYPKDVHRPYSELPCNSPIPHPPTPPLQGSRRTRNIIYRVYQKAVNSLKQCLDMMKVWVVDHSQNSQWLLLVAKSLVCG